MNTQIKSRERVASHGEVFTAEREVKAMCDLVDSECRDYSATFLEPACGNGNFLTEILSRKLSSLHNDSDYERKSLIALSSLYGIDILADNITECRRRLYALWEAHAEHSQPAKCQAKRILQYNILCADTLKPATIIFYEWTFPDNDIVPDGKPFKLSEEVTGQLEIHFDG